VQEAARAGTVGVREIAARAAREWRRGMGAAKLRREVQGAGGGAGVAGVAGIGEGWAGVLRRAGTSEEMKGG
jgi:hypothetical protein